MSKQAIGILIVVIILLLGGAFAFARFNKPSTSSDQQAVAVGQSNPSSTATKGTIQNLLNSGTNISCKVSQPEENSTGMVFVSKDKFRGDFNMKINNQDTTSHMIQSDGFVYVWTDSSKTGTKIDPEAIKKIGNASQSAQAQAQTQAAELNRERDLNCTPWIADQSMFVVPADIKFTDLTQTLKNIPSTKSGTAAPKIDASMCDQISDPQGKAACLKSMNGN